MKKKIILIVIIVIVLGFGGYNFFIKEEKPEFVLEKVVRGTVVKEVSETGAVKISEERNLSFKNAGRIEKIYVEKGQKIGAGQALAKLDTSQLLIELKEAQANLEVAEAKKKDAQVSLENAKQDLKDIKAEAEEELNQAYQDALDTLDDAYLKIYNSFNIASDIQKTYFTANDQEGNKVKDNRDIIENALKQAEYYIGEAKSDSQNEKIERALSKLKEALSNTKEALEVIRDTTETATYWNTVSDSDKTSLDNQKSYISTGHTNVVSAQQTISTTKITNETNINRAKAEISTLETQLGEDGLYPAQINQARAEILLLENKIQEAVLKSPSQGQITKINKREGEMVQPTDSVISFLPSGPFEVEVDIYEEDVVKIRAGDPVKINLVAFPDEFLKGKVVFIDPAEKLIEGVIYYEVTISFEETKKGIKPGMTADIVIETAKKENVLVVSKEVVRKINGKKIIQVFKEGQIEEREIEIGLEGDEYLEIISGLSEGEQVIIK